MAMDLRFPGRSDMLGTLASAAAESTDVSALVGRLLREERDNGSSSGGGLWYLKDPDAGSPSIWTTAGSFSLARALALALVEALVCNNKDKQTTGASECPRALHPLLTACKVMAPPRLGEK